jgi:hypothetical protein
MNGRIEPAERRQRVVGMLVVAALFALPGVAYAQEALRPGGAGATGPAPVRVVRPAPWEAVRAGGTVDVVAAVRAPVCTVSWHDGDRETVVARDGVCRARRAAQTPGVYTLTVSTTGPAGEARLPVAVYDPRGGAASGVGADGGFRVSFAAAYVPWRRTPQPQGTGDLAGPDGLSGEVRAVDWVVSTPDGTLAVRGRAVSGDGTPYGFVAYGNDPGERLRLVVWRDGGRARSPGAG